MDARIKSGHDELSPRHELPGFCKALSLHEKRAREMRRRRCARSLVCEMKKHTSTVTTVTPDHPGIPRGDGVTVSFVVSPETGFVASVTPEKR
jgi:hypothetical protein